MFVHNMFLIRQGNVKTVDVEAFLVDLYRELSQEIHGAPWNGDSILILR